MKISVRANPRAIFVGDTIRYSVLISAKKDISVEEPDIEKNLSAFTIKDKAVSKTESDDRVLARYEYLITKYEPGDYAIPPVTVKYRSPDKGQAAELQAKGFEITVKSVLGEGFASQTSIKISGAAAGNVRRKGREEEGAEPERAMTVDIPASYKIKEIEGPKDVLTVQDIIMIALSAAAAIIAALLALSFLYEKGV